MFKVYTKEYIKDMLTKANGYRDSRGDDFAYGFLTALVKGIVSEMEHEEKKSVGNN